MGFSVWKGIYFGMCCRQFHLGSCVNTLSLQSERTTIQPFTYQLFHSSRTLWRLKTSERDLEGSGFSLSAGPTQVKQPFSRKSATLQKTQRSTMPREEKYGSFLFRSHQVPMACDQVDRAQIQESREVSVSCRLGSPARFSWCVPSAESTTLKMRWSSEAIQALSFTTHGDSRLGA